MSLLGRPAIAGVIGGTDFFSDDAEPSFENLFFHREADSEAFIPVGPRAIIDAEKKVIPRDDQDISFFQSLIKVSRTDGAILEPKPEKEGTLTAMNAIGQAVIEVFVNHRLGEF